MRVAPTLSGWAHTRDRAAAQDALERAHRRSEDWDHDVRWNDADLED